MPKILKERIDLFILTHKQTSNYYTLCVLSSKGMVDGIGEQVFRFLRVKLEPYIFIVAGEEVQ